MSVKQQEKGVMLKCLLEDGRRTGFRGDERKREASWQAAGTLAALYSWGPERNSDLTGKGQVWSGLVSGDTGPSQVLTIFLKLCSYLRLHILGETMADPTIWISSYPRRTYELQGRSLDHLGRAFNSLSSGGQWSESGPPKWNNCLCSHKAVPLWWLKKR